LRKQAIPVRTFADWDDARPGFTEIDLVAHCGDSAHGEFVHSLDLVDITTRWSEQVALPNRSQAAVTAALETARQRLPFPLLGVDSDNGGEFINANLLRYCEQHQLTFTRSRPYRKNDQAHVEQKNWTAVRQIVGYDRYEGQPACEALNALYATRRLYHNCLLRNGIRRARGETSRPVARAVGCAGRRGPVAGQHAPPARRRPVSGLVTTARGRAKAPVGHGQPVKQV
jgi:hypothetical protein